MRYPSPFLASKNSPIITPTRHRPIFTFMLLIMIFLEPGMISLHRICHLLPPRVRIRVIFSLSMPRKPVYRLIIMPNIATDTAVIIIALVLVPSHTISIGARTDLGRLFNTTMKGSRQSDSPLKHHNSIANIMPTTVIIANATMVS